MNIRNSNQLSDTGRVVVAHQPNFMPWAGFFYKMVYADYFILLDEVQFTKGGYTNRVKIRQGDKAAWLTVPVTVPGINTAIKEVEIRQNTFARKHIGTLHQCYARTQYVKPILELISDAYSAGYDRLADLNIHLLKNMISYLGIQCKIVLQSDMVTTGRNNDMLAGLASQLSGTVYVAGQGARSYTEGQEHIYHSHGLDVAYHEFSMPSYEQIQGGFVGGCSLIDAMFNLGPDAGHLLRLQRQPPFTSSSELITDCATEDRNVSHLQPTDT